MDVDKDLSPLGCSLLVNTYDVSEIIHIKYSSLQIPVAARSKAWVCRRSLAGIGSNPSRGMDVYLL